LRPYGFRNELGLILMKIGRTDEATGMLLTGPALDPNPVE
jgi:hypothetical protein